MSSGIWVLPCGQTDRQTDMTKLTVGTFLAEYTDSRHRQIFKPASGGFFILILLNLQTNGKPTANTIPEH